MTSSSLAFGEKLPAARFMAAHRFPYFAAALYAMDVRRMAGIGAIATDHQWRLYVDETLVSEWSVDELATVLVHHVQHLLRDHSSRGKSLAEDEDGQLRWGLACDAEINDDLIELGLPFPSRPFLPADFGAATGGVAEEYFASLESGVDTKTDCGSGADGAPRRWDASDVGGLGELDAELVRCRVAAELLTAWTEAPGEVPGGWLRWAEHVVRPVIDWRRALGAEVRSGFASVAGSVDYSYSVMSRRSATTQPVVLPALRRPVPEIAIVCDTSASMSAEQIDRVTGEVAGVLASVGSRAANVAVVSCDAAVHAIQKNINARELRLIGGGGTDMRKGIEVALSLRPRPQVLVVLTDGFTPWPAVSPRGARVIVVVIGRGPRHLPKWARAIYVEAS